jgi:hypothetical protein
MDHIVTLDSGENEIENIISGNKSMIIHGANVKSTPYGIVSKGDVLYFVNDSQPSEIKAKGRVSSVYNSCRMTYEESFALVIRNQHKLSLPDKLFYKWAGKRYIVLIEMDEVSEVHPFTIEFKPPVSLSGTSA